MHRDHEIFIEAIRHKKKVSITTLDNSQCKRFRPLFYIPVAGKKEFAHYYVWADEKDGIYRFAQEQIVRIESTQDTFESAGVELDEP